MSSDLPHPIRLATSAQREFVASYVLEAAPDGIWIEFKPDRRSAAQNARLWAMLEDIAQQVEWCGKKLTSYDWKDVLSASLRNTRVVPTIDGDGFVPLGMRTSSMTRKEFAALMELAEAFGAERGVVFRAPEHSGDGE